MTAVVAHGATVITACPRCDGLQWATGVYRLNEGGPELLATYSVCVRAGVIRSHDDDPIGDRADGRH